MYVTNGWNQCQSYWPSFRIVIIALLHITFVSLRLASRFGLVCDELLPELLPTIVVSKPNHTEYWIAIAIQLTFWSLSLALSLSLSIFYVNDNNNGPVAKEEEEEEEATIAAESSVFCLFVCLHPFLDMLSLPIHSLLV